MEWQRAVAAMACSCKHFRDLLCSPAADLLHGRATVLRHFNWKAWRPVGRRACAALVRSLTASRAHLITELHLDAASIDRDLLVSALPQLVSLQRLHASHLGSGAAQGLAQALTAGLPSLKHLSCSGPAHLPELPRSGITSLDLPLMGLHGLTSGALSRCLETQTQLQALTIRVSGRDTVAHGPQPPEGLSSMASLMFAMLEWGEWCGNAFPELSSLTLTQHFKSADWVKVCQRPSDPLHHFHLVALEVSRQVLSMFAKECDGGEDVRCFDALAAIDFDLQLPGDCTSFVSGPSGMLLSGREPDLHSMELPLTSQSAESSDSDDGNSGWKAPQVWRQHSHWRLSRAGTSRRCEYRQEHSLS